MPKRSQKKQLFAMSAKKRKNIFVLCLVVLVLLFAIDRSFLTKAVLNPPVAKNSVPSFDLQKYHEKIFTVTKVVDGDTIDIDIANADKNYTRIRLWGVDTPETKKPGSPVMYFGPEATEFTTQKTLGKKVTVYLNTEKSTRDKYGRLLAYIKLPDGPFLNEELLKEGFAYADTRFKHPFYNKYKQLQALAKNQKRGLWKDITIDKMPDWMRQSLK